MKRLILIRHGEAEYSSDPDFQRSLTDNGNNSIIEAAQNLIDNQIFPEAIISSPAQRTVETTSIICDAMKLPHCIINYISALYNKGADAYISEVFSQKEDFESLLIVGHNPSISELANHFSENYFINMAPGSYVVIDFDTNQWNQLFSVKSKIILNNLTTFGNG